MLETSDKCGPFYCILLVGNSSLYILFLTLVPDKYVDLSDIKITFPSNFIY